MMPKAVIFCTLPLIVKSKDQTLKLCTRPCRAFYVCLIFLTRKIKCGIPQDPNIQKYNNLNICRKKNALNISLHSWKAWQGHTSNACAKFQGLHVCISQKRRGHWSVEWPRYKERGARFAAALLAWRAASILAWRAASLLLVI